ncbi:hypothetical protein G5714_008767 [Onychostoma macrolepis]|uniref:Uncharacterized protein n=1 Tax=Onychostoma macrolepis TaxID=369639 RepID=A0A7J6CWM1_9TELE|nr:hypothetical protein G5714_008767 [Onychostoma macrolepis]
MWSGTVHLQEVSYNRFPQKMLLDGRFGHWHSLALYRKQFNLGECALTEQGIITEEPSEEMTTVDQKTLVDPGGDNHGRGSDHSKPGDPKEEPTEERATVERETPMAKPVENKPSVEPAELDLPKILAKQGTSVDPVTMVKLALMQTT